MRSEKGIGAITLVIVVVIIVAVGVGVYMFVIGSETSEIMQPTPSSDVTPSVTQSLDSMEEVTFDVSGKNFEFSPESLVVKKGQKVTVNFTSAGGLHDWVLDEFEAATEQVDTGETSSVTFTADEVGEFQYYCSVGNHRQMGMVGTFTVTE